MEEILRSQNWKTGYGFVACRNRFRLETAWCWEFLGTAITILSVSGCASVGALSYPYVAITNNCRCTEYRSMEGRLEYRFRANYRMQGGIVTSIEIEFVNSSNDTLSLNVGSVKVSSRNIPYQYNSKFVPLPPIEVTPHSSEIVRLTGRDVSGEDDWHKIAGEQLTISIKGIRLGKSEMPMQEVAFVPENPHFIK